MELSGKHFLEYALIFQCCEIPPYIKFEVELFVLFVCIFSHKCSAWVAKKTFSVVVIKSYESLIELISKAKMCHTHIFICMDMTVKVQRPTIT